MENEFKAIITFLENVEPLKKTTRTAWASTGEQESTAEHSWRLALLVACLAPTFHEINLSDALEMALVHDLAETLTGDISAATLPDHATKDEAELAAFKQLIAPLPDNVASHFLELFIVYEKNESPVAHLIKALDKAETIIQHNQGKNPPDFDYAFNLTYGQKFFSDPRLKEFRKLIDEDTEKSVNK